MSLCFTETTDVLRLVNTEGRRQITENRKNERKRIEADSEDERLTKEPRLTQQFTPDELENYRNVFRLKLMRMFCEILSTVKSCSSYADKIIQDGFVPDFVEFLSRNDFPELQFGAAWALGNIASGTSHHTKVVVDHDAVPTFIKLLSSPCSDVREQAVWALGNIVGDSCKHRDLALKEGVLPPLLAQLNEHATLSMLRNVTLTLLNFFRVKPQPPFEQVRCVLPALHILINFDDDLCLLSSACWALSYLSVGSNDKIEALMEAGLYPRLVDLLKHPSPAVQIPAIRTLSNIARDNYQRRAVIDDKLIEPLIYLLQTAEFATKKEVVQAVINIISGRSGRIVGLQDFIETLCDLLEDHDPRIITVCLEGLEIICSEESKCTTDFNFVAKLIDEAQGLDKIKALQSHDNDEIRRKALEVWDPMYNEARNVWKFFEQLGDLFLWC
ncbi:OLC1v1024073C2 [Oldenlandia corymbosa var. corymbosa]|uniref:Importin subunit alpha n=1 Tax=Oldenlandia corymbosa var. corymbosa TaxID=529605 RepID=A0AAV1C1D7_OLDCO|nr:OLC1v1024073C2 [Oldenlandia corymbosa var. corymbosa]